MKTLSDFYTVRDRFQRATRIDAVDGRKDSLDGFILHETARRTIERMRDQIAGGEARAFTWTGPYGTGKSTLALHLAESAEMADTTKRPNVALPGVWKVFKVIGVRADPIATLGVALLEFCQKEPELTDVIATAPNTQKDLLKALELVVKRLQECQLNFLLVIDEMGQFLEYCGEKRLSLIFFQELAERFGRMDNPAVVLGILHQSFQDYAGRIDRGQRNEWAKVQGRFIDTPFSISIEESLTLLGSAIKGPDPDDAFTIGTVVKVGQAVDGVRLRADNKLFERLEACYPLHPVSAILLVAITRQKFGQNERSLFSFLASGEPHGFREYLASEAADGPCICYPPAELWRYLEANLQQSVIASPVGHRWSEALDALARIRKGEELHADLVRVIALIDIFGRSLGVYATRELLATCFPSDTKKAVDGALKDLKDWSALVFRKHTNAYAVSAGSDVDVDEALDGVIEQIRNDTDTLIETFKEIEPAIAKRHYHRTGTLRWYSVHCAQYTDLVRGRMPARRKGADGRLIFVLPSAGETSTDVEALARRIESDDGFPIALGSSDDAEPLINAVVETTALQRLLVRLPELQTDAVARREVNARLALAERDVSRRLEHTLKQADWWRRGDVMPKRPMKGLSQVADWISDCVYTKTPILKNELLNRDRPSANAVAGRRALAYALALNEGEADLGIKKFPPEKGLYLSVLKSTGVHRFEEGRWALYTSGTTLNAIFEAADQCVRSTDNPRSICSWAEIFDIWAKPPFGLKAGLHQLLALTYALANRSRIAIYIDGVFATELDDYEVDRIFQDPALVGVRAVEAQEKSSDLLVRLATLMQVETSADAPATPLDVARALARFAHLLPDWTKRTRTLTSKTSAVRRVLLDAYDPYDLVFQQLPDALDVGSIEGQPQTDVFVAELAGAVDELASAFDKLIETLRQQVFQTFSVEAHKNPEAEITRRAERLRGKTGAADFDSFLVHIMQAEKSDRWIESLVSALADCPPRDSTDDHILRAQQRLRELGNRFRKAEGLAVTEVGPREHAINLFVAQPSGKAIEIVRSATVEESRQTILDEASDEMLMAFKKHKLTTDERLMLAIDLIKGLEAQG